MTALGIFLKSCLFIPIVPLLLHPLFHSAAWKANTLDQEDKDNAVDRVEWLEEACVPEEQDFSGRPGHLHLDYSVRKKSTFHLFKPLSLATNLSPQ